MENKELEKNVEKMEAIYAALKEKLPMPTEEAKDAFLNTLTTLLGS